MLRLLVPLAIASFVSSAVFAQQKTDVKAEVDKITQEYEQAFNKQDASGVVAYMAPDAVYVPATGKPIEGRENIQRYQEQIFKNFAGSTTNITADKVIPLGDGGVTAIGHTVARASDNKETRLHWSASYVREAGQLKTKVILIGLDTAPPTMTK